MPVRTLWERRDGENNAVKTHRKAGGGREGERGDRERKKGRGREEKVKRKREWEGGRRHRKGRTSLWKKNKSRDMHRFCLNFCSASFIRSIDISKKPTMSQSFF